MKEKLTPYSELDAVLEEHGKRIKEVLGNNFVGMYLQGSLAIGDFDLTSDVDFIVVTKQDLSVKQVSDLQQVHTQTYNQDNRWVKRMEYSFFPELVLNTPSSPYNNGLLDTSEDKKLWYFDNGSRTIERSDHCNTLVTRWTVREKGKPVLGPDPKTLVNPIDPNDLRREIKDTLVVWGQELVGNPSQYRNRFYQAYLVLNFARMLHDLHEGRITSKLEGANWAKENLGKKWISLINFCWQERQDPEISIKQPANPEIFERTIEFVRYVVERGRGFKI